MKKHKFKILLGVIAILIAIQFYRPDKYENQGYTSTDLIVANVPPQDVKQMLINTCYDCHSNQTQKYWYSDLAPMAWMVDEHVQDGRKHLNFSDWEKYSRNQQIDYAGQIMFEMYEGEMPLEEYTWMHSEAKLTKKQQNKITEWINSIVE